MNALRTVGALVLLVAGGLSTGCQSRMYEENKQLHNQNRELQAKLDAETRARMAAEQRAQGVDPGQLSQMQSEIATRDAKIAELEKALREAGDQPAPTNGGGNKIAGLETTYDAKAGTVTVNVPGDILFSSGQAELKPSAQATLNKIIAAIKKDHAGKKVYVDGYTDTDPISKTKDKWEDNLDLSAARARSVTKYLTSHGLSPNQVSPRAMGSTAPKATKDKSRRVEIVVVVK